MSAKSNYSGAKRWIPMALVACALLVSAAPRASALIITGGPVYSLPGGGSCTVSGVASQTGGAIISCTGVSLSSHTKVYFGTRVDSIPNGNTMTGANPSVSSINNFRYSSSTGSSITYTSSTSITDVFHGTHAVNNQLVLTVTAGSASVVTTGGTPASSPANGDIERLFQITSGTSFTIRADVKASDAFFGLGQASTNVYDPSHSSTGNGGDRSRVDVAFYYSDCGDGVVDSPEACDEGSGVNGTAGSCCTSTCTFRAAGQVCRPGPGAPCDTNETCTGSAADCPADDAVINGGVVCRAGSGDTCDSNEVCTGIPGQGCPADDAPGKAGFICRLGTTGDICDENEVCTGVPGETCPADDAPGKLNVVCRAGSGDLCDPTERCVGIPGMACPADVVAPPTTVCRAGSSDNFCDPRENCTAIPTQPCPANVVKPAGTDCRPAVDICDVTEECTGVALQSCPANGFAPASTSCNDDADVCTVDECDGSGNCVFDSNLNCDDNVVCSQDSCDATLGCQHNGVPSNSCTTASRAIFKYKDNGSNPKDTIKYLWRGGPSLVADMGLPTTGSTRYELCVYDNGGLRLALGVPAGAGWSTVGPTSSPKGFKYKDTFAMSNGVKLIKTKASSLDKAKVKLTGKGDALPDTADLPFDFPVRAQMYASDGMCWDATFNSGDTKKNDGGSFIGKKQ